MCVMHLVPAMEAFLAIMCASLFLRQNHTEELKCRCRTYFCKKTKNKRLLHPLYVGLLQSNFQHVTFHIHGL